MKSILLEIIITNQCNKRCQYCDLNFHDAFISDQNIGRLCHSILQESEDLEYFHINFFWGEPLLGFSQIQKIVKNIQIPNIKYSLGTNGNLFTKDIWDFSRKHHFDIHLSVDNITGFSAIPDIVRNYKDIIKVNFINDPWFLYNTKKVFWEICDRWFEYIHFMPVFSTKKWSKNDIISLAEIYFSLRSTPNKNLYSFWYFNGISKEKQFVLDTDGYFYQDLDSLLWLQKQYKVINQDLRNRIIQKTKSLSLEQEDFSFLKLLESYHDTDILSLVHEIPKSQWYLRDYNLIKKIFEDVDRKIWV